jgi:hypothetical protein
MGMGKNDNKKIEGTMSYVIMFGYGIGSAHCMCSHVYDKTGKVNSIIEGLIN